jgi:hypothetical protein
MMRCAGNGSMRPRIKPSGHSAADAPGAGEFKTLFVEVVRRVKSRFPKLLERLRKRTTEWNFW